MFKYEIKFLFHGGVNGQQSYKRDFEYQKSDVVHKDALKHAIYGDSNEDRYVSKKFPNFHYTLDVDAEMAQVTLLEYVFDEDGDIIDDKTVEQFEAEIILLDGDENDNNFIDSSLCLAWFVAKEIMNFIDSELSEDGTIKKKLAV